MLVKGSLAVLLGALLYWRFASIGAFRHVAAFDDPWDCRRLFEGQLGQGSEDIAVDDEERFAIISSMSFANVMSSGSFVNASGSLFRLDLEKEELSVLKGAVDTVAPHGIDLVGARLFVVAHDDRGDCVKTFLLQNEFSEATLERSVCSPLFTSPNAVAGRPDGSFLVVNDHSRSQVKSPILAFLETLFGLASSSVVACRPSGECKVVIHGLPPTGVGIAVRDHLTFVSVPFKGAVDVFDQNFELVKRIEIDSGADNLKWSGKDLLIGAHPKLLQVVVHLNSKTTSCPSQVLAIRDATSKDARVEKVLQRMDGLPVAGVSTAIVLRRKHVMLLGTMRDGFALCKK